VTTLDQAEADADRHADAGARWTVALRYLTKSVDAATGFPDGQRMIGEALCAALDTVGGGGPRYQPFSDMREDAAFWADTATPQELEIYAAAALRRIERATFASRARKRLFWALWQEMPADDRDAFLARVRKENAPP